MLASAVFLSGRGTHVGLLEEGFFALVGRAGRGRFGLPASQVRDEAVPGRVFVHVVQVPMPGQRPSGRSSLAWARSMWGVSLMGCGAGLVSSFEQVLADVRQNFGRLRSLVVIA